MSEENEEGTKEFFYELITRIRKLHNLPDPTPEMIDNVFLAYKNSHDQHNGLIQSRSGLLCCDLSVLVYAQLIDLYETFCLNGYNKVRAKRTLEELQEIHFDLAKQKKGKK